MQRLHCLLPLLLPLLAIVTTACEELARVDEGSCIWHYGECAATPLWDKKLAGKSICHHCLDQCELLFGVWPAKTAFGHTCDYTSYRQDEGDIVTLRPWESTGPWVDAGLSEQQSPPAEPPDDDASPPATH